MAEMTFLVPVSSALLAWLDSPFTLTFFFGIVFLLRSQAIHPNDPLTLLLLAIAFLNRSMNRKTENRHLQITQVCLKRRDVFRY